MSTLPPFANGTWSSRAASIIGVLACIAQTSVSSGQTWTTAAPLAETSYNASLPQVSNDGLDTWGTLWSSSSGDAYFSRSSGTSLSWGAPSAVASHSPTEQHKAAGLAADSSGVWMGVGARVGPGSSIEVYRSGNNALTWATPQVIPSTETCYTPTIAASNSGTWIIAGDRADPADSTRHDVVVVRTTDKGLTWSLPVTVGQMPTSHTVALATSGKGVWVALSVAAIGLGDTEVAFNRSADDAATWSPQAMLNTDHATEGFADDPGGIATDGNGNWVAVWVRKVSASTSFIMVARSADNAVTWSTPSYASGSLSGVRNPVVATDGKGNWTIVSASTATSGLYTMLSTDAGATWSVPAVIGGPIPPQTNPGAPSLSANAQGKLVTAFSYGGGSPTQPYFSTTTIAPPVFTADLGVTMDGWPGSADIGTTVVYTITLTNHGPDAATGVSVVDTLPASVDVIDAVATKGSVSAGTGTITDTISTLASGEVVTITVRIRPLAEGTATNTASVSSAVNDPVSTNNVATTNTVVTNPSGGTSADVAVSMTATPDPVDLGTTLTYMITVRNNGPASASSITVTDTIPAGAVMLQTNTTKGTPVNLPGTVKFSIAILNSGDSALLTVRVRPLISGPVSSTVTVSATETDPDASNNSATVTGNVRALGTSDLSATWESAGQTTRRGRTTFSGKLLVSNKGPGSFRSSTIRYYASTDTTWSPDDTPLVTQRLSAVRPLKTKRVPVTIRLQSGATLSGKYVIAVLDPYNVLPELNETNNTAVAGPVN